MTKSLTVTGQVSTNGGICNLSSNGLPVVVSHICSTSIQCAPCPTCTVEPARQEVCAGQIRYLLRGRAKWHRALHVPVEQRCDDTSITVSDAGVYTVTVTDELGCTTQCSGTLVVNLKPTCTVEPATKEVCAGGSATFTAVPVGGTAGYSYLWSNGATTPSITVSEANTYTVTVTDSKGCTTTCEGTLVVNPKPTCVSSKGPEQKYALVVARRSTAAPAGGTPGYTYLWSNGATTPSITVSETNTYTVTVTVQQAVAPQQPAKGTLAVNPKPTCVVEPAANRSMRWW